MKDADITKAATAYMGKAAPATVLLAIGSVLTYAVIVWQTILGNLPILLSFAALSYLVYVTYTPLHEAVHNNIAGNNRSLRWVNEATGYLVANVLGVSYTMHKSAHMTHHRNTNVKGEDPDMVYTGEHLYDLFTSGSKMVTNEYRHYFTRNFPAASIQEQVTVLIEILAFISWRVALGVYFPLETVVLCLLSNVAGVTILGYIFAWLVHTPFDQTERFKNTSTLLLPRGLNRIVTTLWLWQNYHSIHHLFPRVPFYQYARLFGEIQEGMIERGAPVVHLGRKNQVLQHNA